MRFSIKYPLLIALLMKAFCAYGANYTSQDTIPPVFTQLPSDTIISCELDPNPELINWLDNHASAIADNGEAQIINLLTNQEAIDTLEHIQNSSCSQTAILEVGFIAQDSCNNNSVDTVFANFIIEDTQAPQFIIPPQNQLLDCHYGILDSLQMWLDNIGFAFTTDNCSDTILRTNYSWIDDLGNSGFSDPNVPTNIIIERINCNWSVEVSFFIEDECSNINVAKATFGIDSDMNKPDIISAPGDTLILCSETIPDFAPLFVDGCDGELSPTFIQNDTRDPDSLLCGHYNYDITRNWTVTDACGNISAYTQLIQIRDTLAPTINYQSIVAADCDENLGLIENYISYFDNCLFDTISYTDSIIISTICQEQLIRSYTLIDVCQNQQSIEQTFQIQDFSSPEFDISPRDTIIDCGLMNPELFFDIWIDSLGFSMVSDNCNSITSRALPPGTYVDTSLIMATENAKFNIVGCPDTTVNGILGFQFVDFVNFDLCGNISTARASFTLIDTTAPVIFSCPQDLTITLEENQCDSLIELELPIAIDNCSDLSFNRWRYKVNQATAIYAIADTFNHRLDAGENKIEFILKDCGGNEVDCQQSIFINDAIVPILNCPDDLTIFLENDQCETNYFFEALDSYSDNCGATIDYAESLPIGNGLVDFVFDQNDSLYHGRNSILSFQDIILRGKIYNPRIIIDWKLNIDPGSSVTINSELGDLLYVIDSGDCTSQSVSLELNSNQVFFWLSDQTVNFTVIHIDGFGDGTFPCDDSNLSGDIVNDGESFIKIKLEFSDIDPTIEVSNNNSQEIISHNGSNIQLLAGIYNLNYNESDVLGNQGMCNMSLEIRDTISPIIQCQDIIVEAEIQASEFYDIIPENLIQTISDNCGIDSIRLNKYSFSCADIGSSLNIQVEAVDIYKNVTQCNSIVTIKGVAIEPTFLSDLCFADSLQLFAGVVPSLVDSFIWSGPSDFKSFDPNPLLLSIDNSNSGIYFLEIISINGCSFVGSVNIEVNEFSSPQISSDSTAYCVGDVILLNATPFTEEVNYFWYEGISPNGILIQETEGPSLTIQGTQGKHFYYVEVRSDLCNSNPSSTISIDILPVPIAEIDQPFVTICEGDNIVLSTNSFNSIYNYEWSGPNGYFSRERIPEVISDAGFTNEGIYFLSINNGICTSDTASVQVVIFEKPPIPIIEGETIFCEGQSAVLTVSNISNAVRYHWYKDGVIFNSVSSNNLLIPAITESQSGLYTVVVEDGICFSDTSASFELLVESNINIGAANNGPLCEGDEVVLTSSFIPDATYLWEDPAGLTYTGREIMVPAIEGVYTVTVTTASNCMASTSTNVEVGIRPNITALSNTSIPCMSEGMSISFIPTVFPSGNYNYVWSGPNMFSSAQENPVLTNLSESFNGEYFLEVIKDNCASQALSTIVDITIIPIKPIIDFGDFPCEADTVKIEVTNPIVGSNVEWLWSTPLGLIVTDVPYLILENFENNQIGNYSVLQSKNGCRSETSNVTFIELISKPDQPTIIVNDFNCIGSDIIFETSEISGAEYVWSTPSGLLSSATNELIIENVSSNDEGPYSLKVKVGNCFSESSNLIDLELKSQPEAPEFNTDSLSYCINGFTTAEICLIANQADSIDLYQIIDLNSGSILLESESNCFELSFLNTGQQNSFLLGAKTVIGDCSSETLSTLSVNFFETPLAGANITEDLVLVCDLEFANLTALNPENLELQWISPDPQIEIFNSNSNDASFSQLREGTNQIILLSSNGECKNFASDTAEIFLINNIEANDDLFNDVFLNTIIIVPLENDNYNSGVTITSVSDPGSGTVNIVGNQIHFSPPNNLFGSVEIEYEICYDLCPDLCSTAIITIELDENIDCFAGNIITPNGDGYNDRFEIPCLYSGNYQENELSIFNQWGDELYHAEPYQNEWEGDYDGQTLPPGSYYYVLKLGPGLGIIQGFIIIEL